MRSTRRSALIVIGAVVVVLLGPAQSAWAWGPATHVEIANEVLRNLSLLPAALALLLARQRSAYLYGALAADVVFAKRMSRVRQFCHHWSTGFRLLERAVSEPERAFACGYLSHLAADTVAHGKYVPRQIALTGCSMNFGHFYWELRADTLASGDAWAELRAVVALNHEPHHATLSHHLRGTFLPFSMNRRLFTGMNQAILHPLPRRAVETLADYSRHALPGALVRGYHQECADRTFDLLKRMESSALLREDPNGASSLAQVRMARRDLRRWERHGRSADAFKWEFIAGLAPARTGDPAPDPPWTEGLHAALTPAP